MEEAVVTRSPPQVTTLAHYDGELGRKEGVDLRFYEKTQQMRRDPTIKLARWFATAPLMKAEWGYECSRKDLDPMHVDLVKDQMTYLREELIRNAIYGWLDYGWQAFEKSFTIRDDGLFHCRYLKPLLQKYSTILVMPGSGEFAGIRIDACRSSSMSQMLENNGLTDIYLSKSETLLTWCDSEGTDWYGEPAMKAAEEPYDEAKQITKNARIYDKKIAGAHWVIYYPRGTSEIDGATLDNGEVANRLLKSLEAVGSIAVPRSIQEAFDVAGLQASNIEALQWKIELMSDSGSGQTPFIERLKYLDALKVRAFGFPERALLEGTYGTKAEAEAHADLAITGLEMRHRLLVNQINRDLVDQTVFINAGPGYDGAVKIVPAPIADEARGFLRQVYMMLLQHPEMSVEEIAAMDRKAIQSRVSIPALDVDSVAEDPYADPLYEQQLAEYEAQNGYEEAVPAEQAPPAEEFPADEEQAAA